MSIIIAIIVLTVIPIIPLIPTWILSLVKNQEYEDPARRGVGWLKAAIPVFILGLLGKLVFYGIIYTSYTQDFSISSWINYPSYIGTYLRNVATILTFIALIQTGLGFLYVRSKGFVAVQPPPPGTQREKTLWPKSHTTARAVTYTLAALLLATATTAFGLGVAATVYDEMDSHGRGDINPYNNYITYREIASKVGTAFDISFFVLAIPLNGFAISVVSKCKGSVIAKSSRIYVAAVFIFFVRFLWRMIYQIGYVLVEDSKFVPQATTYVQPILDQWSVVVILILLYVIFAANHTGIWSIARPWMSYQQPVYQQPDYAPPTPAANFAYESLVSQADSRQLHEMHQTPSPIYTNTSTWGVRTFPPAEVKG